MDAPFKAIADPNRRRILRLVAGSELSAGEIAEAFDITRPAVSQHLAALRGAGLVSERRQGTRRLYRSRPEGVAEALLFLQDFWDERLTELRGGPGGAGPGEARPMRERLCLAREVAIAAPPEAVWSFLTDAARMTQWMGRAATLAARPGGVYRVEVVPDQVASGEFVEVEAPRRLAHSWGWEGYARAVVPPGSSLVDYELRPAAEGTELRLQHHFLPSVRSAGSHSRGWAHYLERLVVVAGGGSAGADPWVTDPTRFRAELRP